MKLNSTDGSDDSDTTTTTRTNTSYLSDPEEDDPELSLPSAEDYLGDAFGDRALDLLRNPVSFIFGAIATWVVKNVFIGPSKWVLALIDFAFARVDSSLATAGVSVDGALATAGAAFVSGPETAVAALRSAMTAAGLAAPIASTLSVGLLLALVGGFVYVLVRILLDVVPGGGAFT
jgi:hypothetical protein